MTTEDAFVVRANGALGEIRLNRPSRGNRLTLESIAALANAIEELSVAPDRRVIAMRAAGDDFCLGREPDAPGLGFAQKNALKLRDRIVDTLFRLFAAIRNAPQPVVAVVRGSALGFGCALAGGCDVTLASDRARFGLNELLHDKPPLMALSVLVEVVPVKTLSHMVYSTRPLDAAMAERVGLASRVVSDANLDAEADELVAALGQRSLGALTAVKQFLRTAPRLDPDAATKLAGNMFATVVSEG